MTKIMDKIDHAIILSKRIQNEMNSGNFDNALYLTDTFVFLFSGHKAATRDLVTAYTAVSQELLTGGQLEQAEALISKGLIVDPQNSQMLAILVEIKKSQHQVLQELGRRSAADPEPFALPLYLLKAGQPRIEVFDMEALLLREKETEGRRLQPGYEIVDREGRVVLPQELLIPKPKPSFQSGLAAPQLPVSTSIRVAQKKSGRIRHINLTIEYEDDQVILSFAMNSG